MNKRNCAVNVKSRAMQFQGIQCLVKNTYEFGIGNFMIGLHVLFTGICLGTKPDTLIFATLKY